MESRDWSIVVGTETGLYELGGALRLEVEPFAGRPITSLAAGGGALWALVDGREVWRGSDGGWHQVTRLPGPAATCLAPSQAGLLIGTEQAHLVRVQGEAVEAVEGFEEVAGRERWYTPWGDPAEVRSIAVDAAGVVLVNVHVGGIARSEGGGRTWTPTVDIDVDVHQVACDPARPGLAYCATAEGLGLSDDAGRHWRFQTAGLHARYCRAVAAAGDAVLVSASTGPAGRRAALYRRAVDGPGRLERCRAGLPDWFAANVDTGCLAASGALAALGTEDGSVYASPDGSRRWAILAKGLPPIRAVVFR
jgi:hypothetical protein